MQSVRWHGLLAESQDPSYSNALERASFGILVPLLVISPYARTGVIDHHLGIFSSVLRLIEDNWGLLQLTARDGAANDLSYDFDFAQKPQPPDRLSLRTNCSS